MVTHKSKSQAPQPKSGLEKEQDGTTCSSGCAGTGADPITGSATAGQPPKGNFRLAFKIEGLDCVEEVAILKREIGPLVGGDEQLSFDVLNGRMFVLANAKTVSAEAIKKAVARTGMRATVWREGTAKGDDGADRHRSIQAWLTGLSGVMVLLGLALHVWLVGGLSSALELFSGHDGQSVPLPEMATYTLAIGLGGRYVVVKAWYAARRLRPDMNLLMVIAVAGAIGIGEWFEAATVTFLFSLSLALEGWSVGRARRAIEALLDLVPSTVRLKTKDGKESEVLAADVAIGSRFIVYPGERIALDGVVALGTSAVNQAPITGESIPVAKQPGEVVFAGTINGDGVIEIDSTKAAADTTLARIIRMVGEAHSRRAPSEQWVEKFAAIYTPAVMALAIAVFLVPPLLFGGLWEDWFYRALVLLVIACPCALVISTPVSIVAALAASARQGVLIKGGSYVEQPARLKAIAFDKTGTITRGEPVVVNIIPFDSHTEKELLERAVALEMRSTHPLATAIIEYGKQQGLDQAPAANVKVLPGKGVTGSTHGEDFWLGSHRYLLERGQETKEVTKRAREQELKGRSVILVGNQRHVCGLISVADTIRPTAGDFVKDLRSAGVEHPIMLTGDNFATAEAIAGEVGITEVRAEMLPEDKVAAIEELTRKYGTVAMVGDGVNDAPAMARASFGIAMGAIGSDAAIETADIALMTDDLSKVSWLIGHSRRTSTIIKANIVFALGVKAVFVALTFFGFATLWGAIAADAGASLLVVANGLRLMR